METLQTPDLGSDLDSAASLSETGVVALPTLVIDPAVHQMPLDETVAESVLTRWLSALGLDRAVIFTVLARGWSSLAGIATLTLIARLLTRVEQGYYYTFYSLVALQIVFELGFSTVILQSASHEAAHLEIGTNGPVTGPAVPHARLASVLQKSVRWYSLGALLMIAVLLPVGIRFIQHEPCCCNAGALDAAVVPGGGRVRIYVSRWIRCSLFLRVADLSPTLRVCGWVRRIVGTVLGWLALVLHHGLLAPGLMNCRAGRGGWCVLGAASWAAATADAACAGRLRAELADGSVAVSVAHRR